MSLWDVGAWRLLFFPEDSPKVRFFELFWIRLAGEALNNVTPFLDVGGEPLKVRYLSKRFGLSGPAAVASTVIAKTSNYVSEAVFMLAGALFSFSSFALTTRHRTEIGAALLAVCVVFAGFFVLQRQGAFRRMNTQIERFYKERPARFWGAVSLNFLGWALGGVETYFFCRLTGLEVSLTEAVVLEALLQLVRTASFFIPMNLGVQEGGLAFFAGTMGFDPVAGVGISLLKRFRQIVWTSAGFLAWARFKYSEAKKRPASAREAEVLSMDTRLDRWIHRPPANVLALCLSGTRVTPNQVTVLSLVPAFLSCGFFSAGQPGASLAALFFFYLWSVMDHADGALARLKKQTSALGRLLDDLCDILASTAVLCGVFWGLVGLWDAGDRLVLSRYFYSALFLNALSGFLGVRAKRRSRQRAVEAKAVSEAFLWKKKVLDRLTGRDSFYVFLLLVIVTQAAGPSRWAWYSFTMGFLIISQWVVSAVAFYESVKRAPLQSSVK